MSRIGEFEKTIVVEPLEEPIPAKESPEAPEKVLIPLKKIEKEPMEVPV